MSGLRERQREMTRNLIIDAVAELVLERGAEGFSLEDVAVRAKPMPDAMINEDGNFPSEVFLEYARPLVGELPEYADLDFDRVR